MTGQHCRSRSVGTYRASEICNLVYDRMYKPNGTRRGVIMCHGAGQDGDGNVNAGVAQGDVVLALVAAGYPVVCCDLGASLYSWGNDDAITAMGSAFSFLTSSTAGKGGAKTDKVFIYGSSMGAAVALNWTRQNLSSVAAVAASIPVLDLDDMYQNDKGSYQSSIGTAYGVTYPTSLPNLSTHSPVAYGSTDLASLPLELFCTTDDTIASNTTAAGSWNKAGATATVTSLGAGGGNGHNTSALDPQQIVSFFDANGGRS